MSPRAAWRLESLGFGRVYDYAAGEADWLAAGLPSEGPESTAPRAGQVVRRDVPTCGLSERLGDVRERVRASGAESCLVLNGEGVVLGRLRGEAFAGHPETAVEEVMEAGPGTVRPSEPLAALVERMRARQVGSVVVTTADGRLVGVLHRDDAERRLAELAGGRL